MYPGNIFICLFQCDVFIRGAIRIIFFSCCVQAEDDCIKYMVEVIIENVYDLVMRKSYFYIEVILYPEFKEHF